MEKRIHDFLPEIKGKTQQQIADIVNCSSSNISYILNKKTWQV